MSKYKQVCESCKIFIPSICTKINIVRQLVTYNIPSKFELDRMHQLDTIIFLILCLYGLQCVRIKF